MSTLILGRTALLSRINVEDYLPNEKVVVCTATPLKKNAGRIIYTDVLPSNDDFYKLFEIHDFDNVIFLSDLLDPITNSLDENEDIYKILLNCRRFKVKRSIFIFPMESFENASIERKQRFDELNTIIHFFSDFMNLDLQCLYIPYVLNSFDESNFLCKTYLDEDLKKLIPWNDGENISFIDIFSLLEFLRNFFANDEPGELEMFISPDFSVTISSEYLSEKDFQKYYNSVINKKRGRFFAFLKRTKKYRPVLSNILTGLFIILFSAVIELIMRLFESFSPIYTIDMRLIFIIVSAFSSGAFGGTLSSVTECIFLFLNLSEKNYSFSSLMSNPENLIPFLFYILLGSGIGYLKDRQNLDIEMERRERNSLRLKVEDDSVLYNQVVKKKNEYKEDLLNSKNGFGKIFDAVNRLSSVEPNRILAESIPVMEDILDNKTISVYSGLSSNKEYARLQVASKDIYDSLPKSIKLTNHPEIIESLQKGEVWFNKDLKSDLSMYVAPVMRETELIALIMIKEVDFDQTSLYYQNLLSIISRLIGNFVVTAISYQEAIEDQNYVSNTKIYDRNVLDERLELFNSMQDDQISNYRMIMIMTDGRPLTDIDKIIRPLIRPMDFVGLVDKSKVLLICSNTDDVGQEIVIKRLRNAGLNCKAAKGIDD